MKKQFLEIGQIVTTHGIKGEVRVKPWCDEPEFLTDFDELYYDKGKVKVEIEEAKVHKNVVVMKIKGINDMNTAQTLRNRILYINRDDVELEEGSYFIQDLIGMKVIDDRDESMVYGELVEVSETGANDVYHIKTEEGKIILIPAIPDVVKNTDTDGMVMRIVPLNGLFDDED